ncbi:hypothetical protein PoB_007096700 [Plakobranchus ocellatus]|uniref:Uncharacterized protein n=1 Tax=Plakobranchus ocellatus TaxID=259542 RepID=A0AAV4DJK9_9GAST|nr:hypothetical protein PoB_007096700 [Plakobranchus ocellatus]
MPVQAPVTYWFPKKVYHIKQGVQSLMGKTLKRSTAGFDYESNAGGSRDRAKSLRLDSHFLGMGRAAKPSKNLRRPI